MAEELGFDHAWLVDHLVDTDGPPENGCLEGVDAAGRDRRPDQRIRLGVLVSSNTFRNPALLLKEAVTVDHISGGRLILGIGTGWHEDEHRRYGIDLPAAGRAGRPVRGGGRADQPADEPGADDVRTGGTTGSTTRASSRGRSSGRGSRSSSPPIGRGCSGSPPGTRTSGTRSPRCPGTATEGVEAELAERIAAPRRGLPRDRARPGRDPPLDLGDARGPGAPTDAYVDFVRRHRPWASPTSRRSCRRRRRGGTATRWPSR